MRVLRQRIIGLSTIHYGKILTNVPATVARDDRTASTRNHTVLGIALRMGHRTLAEEGGAFVEVVDLRVGTE